MGIPCYHIMQEHIAQLQVLYLHDFHRRWFFNTPPEDFVQAAPRPILDPIIVRTKGRPTGSKSQQPKSSTQRDPSHFEQQSSTLSKKNQKPAASKFRKRIRIG